MAYTYEDFLGAASKSGMLGRFSESDLQIAKNRPEYGLGMLTLYKDYDGASSEDNRLLTQAAMDNLRQSYGGQDLLYSTGVGTKGSFGSENAMVNFGPDGSSGGGTTTPSGVPALQPVDRTSVV